MNILFITKHLNVGGITSYLYTLGTGLKKRGHRVYIASSGGETEKKFEEQGIALIKVPLTTKSEASPKIFLSVLRLLPVLKKEKIGVIHANTRVAQVLSFWLSKMTGVPYVSTCHGFFKPRLSRRMFPLWGKKVIAISDSVYQHLIQDFKVEPQRIKVVYNGIDLERFRTKKPEDIRQIKNKLGLGDGPVISIIARLSDVKGHVYLVRAFCEVLQDKPDTQLLIVGEGNTKKMLLELTAELGLRNVYFVPAIKDTRQVFAVSDVFVMPSLQEGLGLALMEAMAFGLAVIGSDVGGIRNLIKDHSSGILTKPADPESLSGAILELLNDEAKRRVYGENARRFITENFSQDRMIQETEGIYENI